MSTQSLQGTAPDTAIALQDVHLRLSAGAGPVHILKGISLTVKPRESLALIGPSGSGKSSLLMLMGGLERASAGRIHVAGTDITQMNEDQLAQFRQAHMGVVFQSFHLIPTMTALENVATPLELAGDRAAHEKARAELDLVGLGKRAGHYPAQMSGGEQQRVALARASVTNPQILLADEPTGNLDQTTGDTIVEHLFSLQRDKAATLVLVTHSRALAQACDRIISIRDGQLEP